MGTWNLGCSLAPQVARVHAKLRPPALVRWGLWFQAASLEFHPTSCVPCPCLPLPHPHHPSTCRNLSSEVFCFMSQLLLSFFSPSVPGDSQEHFPDILKLLAPHPRLKEHVESMATEGTSHNLPKLSQVKLNSPSSLAMLHLAVVWANVGVSPTSPSVPEKEEMDSLVVVFFARRLFLTDKTRFQAWSQGGLVYYLHFFSS